MYQVYGLVRKQKLLSCKLVRPDWRRVRIAKFRGKVVRHKRTKKTSDGLFFCEDFFVQYSYILSLLLFYPANLTLNCGQKKKEYEDHCQSSNSYDLWEHPRQSSNSNSSSIRAPKFPWKYMVSLGFPNISILCSSTLAGVSHGSHVR